MTSEDVTRMFNGESAKAVREASLNAKTGSADWWAILYEDTDRKPELFTDESAAIKTFNELRVAWSCHLFRRVPPNNNSTPPVR